MEKKNSNKVTYIASSTKFKPNLFRKSTTPSPAGVEVSIIWHACVSVTALSINTFTDSTSKKPRFVHVEMKRSWKTTKQ